MDIITYGLLIGKIKSAGTGIADITKENGYIVFVMDDGRTFRIEDSTKDIINVDIDNDGYIVVTYQDGTSTISDNPIPYPSEMTGATASEDGTGGLIPKPTKGDVKYFNSRGEWDDTPRTALEDVSDRVDALDEVIPTDDIPQGSTLTADGWAVATAKEVADEFAQWEG